MTELLPYLVRLPAIRELGFNAANGVRRGADDDTGLP